MITALVIALLLQASAPRPQPAAAERPVPSTGSGQTQPPAAPSGSPPTETYTYQPEGRRDPFVSLLGTGTEPRGSNRGEGPAGMTVGEISVRGVMQSRGTMVAMIQGPDNKTYIVHPGDKLLDGAIKSITMQGLVVDQQVSDPLSIVKHREVSKLLRSYEGAKE